jgi:FKBP-type peptidyl-prolyl cis-trans isomerase
MKRKLSLLAFAAAALLWQSCSKDPTDDTGKKIGENDQQIQRFLSDSSYTGEKTASGLVYIKTLQNLAGVQPVAGSQVYVHYAGRRMSDNFVFDQSDRSKNQPLVFALNSGSVLAGFDEGISLMREGEKAKLLIPSYLGYWTQVRSELPAYSVLKFEVELTKVRTEDEALRVFATDSLAIVPSRMEVVSAAPGTYYVKVQEGTGVAIQNGQRATTRFRGRLINGGEFATAGSSDSFIMGQGLRIKGYEEAVRRMKVGERGLIFIPSSQAYGIQGATNSRGELVIPRYAPLIYDIELVSVQ